MGAKNIACSACYGSGYGVDEKPCPCGCRHPPAPEPAIAPPVAPGSVDTVELGRLARNATRGLWRHTRQGVIVAGPFRQYTNGSAQSQIASFCVTSHEEDDEHQTEKQVPNALFSAAACPDVVLALIERAEKAEARVKELEAAYQEVLRRCL